MTFFKSFSKQIDFQIVACEKNSPQMKKKIHIKSDEEHGKKLLNSFINQFSLCMLHVL